MACTSTVGKCVAPSKLPRLTVGCAAKDGPGEAVVSALGLESETPERVWSQNMATTAALEIASLADTARSSQVMHHVPLQCLKS